MSEVSAAETATARAARLRIEIPEPPAAAAQYEPCRRDGDHLYIAGQVPFVQGRLTEVGRVGADVDLAAAQRLARVSALNALGVAAGEVGLNHLRAVNLVVYVSSAPDFFDQHLVADGASAVLHEVLGEHGRHARTAVATPALPLNSPVEVQALFRVEQALDDHA